MITDALSPSVCCQVSSNHAIRYMRKRIIVFHQELFKSPAPFQGWEW